MLHAYLVLLQSTHEELEAEAGKHGYSCIMLKPLRATSMATALLQVSQPGAPHELCLYYASWGHPTVQYHAKAPEGHQHGHGTPAGEDFRIALFCTRVTVY